MDAAIWLALNLLGSLAGLHGITGSAYLDTRPYSSPVPLYSRRGSHLHAESLNILGDALAKLEEAAVAVALPVPEVSSCMVQADILDISWKCSYNSRTLAWCRKEVMSS